MNAWSPFGPAATWVLATAVLTLVTPGCSTEAPEARPEGGVTGGSVRGESVPGETAHGEIELRRLAASEPIPSRFGLGRPATQEEIRAQAIAVMPDGRGLPEGSGTAREGAPLYAALCAACHGARSEGGIGGAVAGRIPGDAFDFGDGMEGPRTIGSYWPYATTVFDYVRRSMPWDRPGSLSDEEVYRITAYLLFLNEIIGEDEVMDRETLPAVGMPARDRFVPDDRLEHARVW
jgi:S-disulfanyl-L-cysteine oxidoreductase SoxD